MMRTLLAASAILVGATFGAAALPGGSPAQHGIATEAPVLDVRGERHGWGHRRGRHGGWDRGRHRGWYKHHNRRHGHRGRYGY